jgi:uncharacterized membrane protein
MDVRNPRSTAKSMGHPIHPTLVPFPIAFLFGAFVTDILFWRGGNPFWATASRYLIGAALVFAVLAALAGLTDFLGDKAIRRLNAAWAHMIGNVVAVVLSLINFFLRLHDAQGPIVPTGLILSTIVVIILIFTGWMGGELVFRHRVGVADDTI